MTYNEVIFSIANLPEWTNAPLMEVESSVYRGRIIPSLIYRVSGLIPDSLYYVQIRLARFDNQKYVFDYTEQRWCPRNNNNPPWESQTLEFPGKMEDGNRIVKSGKEWMKGGIDFTNVFIGTKEVPNTFVIKNAFVYFPTIILTLIGGPSWEFSNDCQKFVAVSVYSSMTVAAKKRGIPPDDNHLKRRRRGYQADMEKIEDNWVRGDYINTPEQKLDGMEKNEIMPVCRLGNQKSEDVVGHLNVGQLLQPNFKFGVEPVTVSTEVMLALIKAINQQNAQNQTLNII